MSTANIELKSRRQAWKVVVLVATVTLSLLAAVIVPFAANANPVLISGKVTLPTGSPASGVSVQVIRTSDGVVEATAITSSSGMFSISNVTAPEEYTLKFAGTSTTFEQYLGGASGYDDARRFTVYGIGSGATFTTNVALQASGTLSGTVKTSTGTVLSSATVTIYKASGTSWTRVRTAKTTSTGYTVTGLEPGDYRIKVSRTGYTPVFSGNAASLSSAKTVGVFAKKTTAANLVFGLGATINGIVSGNLGSAVPLSGVTVQAIRFIGSAGAYTGNEKVGSPASSSSSGAFSIGTLPPGDYTLLFTPTNAAYGTSYLGGESHADSATVFTVTSGASLTGKNITLVGSGTLTGQYTDGSVPLENVRVTVNGYTADPDALDLLKTTFTDVDGQYTFTGLGPGTYTVVFGSFADANPADGVTENTDYRRRTLGTSVSSGATTTLNRTTSLRGVLAAVAPPTLSASEWKVGIPIYLSDSTWSANSGAVGSTTRYSWHRDGVLIAGATSWNYTPGPGDMGHTLTATNERYDWEYGTASSESTATDPINQGEAATVANSHAPNIGGVTPHVGDLLTLDLGEWEAVGSPANTDLGISWEISWERSDNGADWGQVGTGRTYTVTANDLTSGPRLRVSMRGDLYGYADSYYTVVAIPWVEAGTFQNTKLPTVKATSSTYSVSSNGTWLPAPTSFTYAWKIYDETLSVIETRTTPSITRASVAGKFVELVVTPNASNVTGTGATIVVQTGMIHTTTSVNSITGDARVGEVLIAPAYSWSPSPDTTTRKWQYLTGTTWKTISGATAGSYTVPATYKGRMLRVLTYVSTPGFGSAAKTSLPTVLIKTGFAPVVSVSPSHSGETAAMRAVTVNPGTWLPAATSYSYQWRYRTTEFGTPVSISGATKATYTISSSLTNRYLDVKITVNRSGHASATFVSDLGLVLPSLNNLSKPTASNIQVADPGNGNPFGTRLAVESYGTWSTTPEGLNYVWIAIGDDGSESTLSPGTTFYSDCCALYRPVDLEVTAYKVGYAPGVVRIPVKNGILETSGSFTVDIGTGARVGSALSTSGPALNSPPIGHSTKYQWEVFTSGQWKAISGATSSEFTPSSIYSGRDVRATLTYSAARYTSVQFLSDPVTVAPGTVVIIDESTTTTTAAVGKKLTYTAPKHEPTGTTIQYLWQSSTSEFGAYANIAATTTNSYTPKESDVGKWVRMTYSVSKAGYTTSSNSTGALEVQPGMLSSTTAPKVTRSGYTLQATAGTWSVTGLTSTSYEWRRYVADASSYSVVGSDSSTYSLVPADDGRLITVAVTVAKAPAWGSSSAVVIAQPGGTIKPSGEITVSGSTEVGNTLTVSIPGWQQGSPVVAARWYRNGIAISGATTLAHTVVASDIGKKLTVKVAASLTGFTTYSSTLSAGVGTSFTIPVNVTAPVASPAGQVAVDSTLTTTNGAWSVSSMSYTYQWYRGAQAITGATSASYTASAPDIGFDVRAKVTASKAGYTSVSAWSELHTVVHGASPTQSAPLTLSVSSTKIVPNAITWDMPVTVLYQWQVSTDSGATYSNIADATTTSLALADLNPGDYVKLFITASRPGHDTTVLQNFVDFVVP